MDLPQRQWPNAPLLFVLAAAQFAPYPNFEAKIDSIHEALLQDFPYREPVPVLPPGTTGYRFTEEAHGFSMTLLNGRAVFECTTYHGHEAFFARVQACLDALQKSMPLMLFTFLGLRYINAVLEQAPESLASFVAPNLQPFSLRDRLPVSRTINMEFAPSREYRVRCSLLSGQKPQQALALPEGVVLSAALKLNRRLTEYIEFQGPCAMLDIDASLQQPLRGTAEEVTRHFHTLRSFTHEALVASTTEAARQYWIGKHA